MLLLDQLVEASAQHAICTWRVPDEHPIFGTSQGVPSYVGIECMAQCIAVLGGAKASLDGFGPPLGLLLGTRRFEAGGSHLKCGVEYHVSCLELVRDSQGLASFDCEIRSKNSIVAACRLAVFERLPGSKPFESA
jgi:predicted hotdog family 3-hydroxylacyl-ACP dehydratase